jgi:MinD-like ATPase involved in chromosome partitioning or flagellar assembly
MLDQAQDLRRLAHRHAPPDIPSGGRPALVVVLGGKGGVGSTTVGLNLAVVLAQSGRKTVLIDADPRGGDVALMCGIEERSSIVDLLEAQLPWEEALQPGPSGIKLVAGHRGWHEGSSSPAASAKRILARLEDPNLDADLAVIDAGNSLDGPVPHLCRMADAVLLVTTTDAAAVVNTFAAIKTLVAISQENSSIFSGNRLSAPKGHSSPSPGHRPGEIYPIEPELSAQRANSSSKDWPDGPKDEQEMPHFPGRCPGLGEWLGLWPENPSPRNSAAFVQNLCPLYLLVNMAPSGQAAKIVHYRLARACRRLLGIELTSAGHLEKAGKVTGNESCQPIRLNLPSSATDTMRRLLAADVMLNWRRREEFNGLIQRQSAK